MASLTRGTTFVTGVANDVTADKLHALVDAATPTSGFIQDRTSESAIAADDTLLFGDFSDSSNLKRITVANFNNVVTTGTGTAASPAIVPTGDSNTGVFFPAADTIAFSEGGVEAMRIDSSGNVGIGTTSPAAKIHVQGAGTTSAAYTNGDAVGQTLYLQDTGNLAGNGGQILFGASQGVFAGIKSSIVSGTGPAGSLIFQTRDTTGNVLDRMTVTREGLVGIGTASPVSKFHVASGSITISNDYGIGAGDGAQGIYNGTNNTIRFDTASTERLRIDSSGSLILAGSTAQKASGTTWSNPSDIRIKKNIRDYEKGLDSLMQVRVREWEYNGKAGTVADTKSMGVVADEVQTILPDTVSTYKAKLNPEDEEDSDIKKFDATEITWLLVKAVQELSAKVTALEAA